MTDEQSESSTKVIANDFETFGLSDPLLVGLKEAGFKVPSPIQKKAIPLVLSGKDVIAQAQTGTGKTAAFGLPAMNFIKHKGSAEVLVITPTRELASQVSSELFRLGKFADIRTVAVYGGQSISRQVDLVNRGAQILVATPGRLLDHLKSGRFKKFEPEIVVLDEADEMLDMGFITDLEAIFKFLPEKRQTLLFSATMPPAIRKLANKILHDPVEVKTSVGSQTGEDIVQRYYVIREWERTDAMVRLMESENPEKTLIFCRTKKETESLSNKLVSLGHAARALHGDMEQRQREVSINSFRKGEVDILVATDVAARGLDVTGISHVFNYHIPFDVESYVHRIGRTGRAGKKGLAITLVTPPEYRAMRRIKQVTKAPIEVYEVPTIKEVEKLQDKKLILTIHDQAIKEESAKILSELEKDHDLRTLASKVISLLMEESEISGADKIGMNKGQVENLSHAAQTESKGKRYGKPNTRYAGNRKSGDGRPSWRKNSSHSSKRPSRDK